MRSASDATIPFPRVSLIIPVHKGRDAFHTCLNRIGRLSPPPAELIVVLDGPDPESRAHAQQAGARILSHPVPHGPAAARNLGATHATGEILFFVDADVALPMDAIAIVAAGLSNGNQVDALIGSYDECPPEPDFFSRFKNLFHHYIHQNSREDARTFWGACGAIRREVFQQVGGFNPSYRKPSVEDIELGGRLHRAGYRIRLLKSFQVTHLKRWGRRGMITTDILYRAIPWTRMILRQQALPNDLNLTIVDRISALMALGIALGLAGAAFRPLLLMPVAGMTLLLLTIHRKLYRFFHRKGGFAFAVRGIWWHWIYYLYSLAGFGAGILYHAADKIGIFRTSSVSANSGS